MPPDIVELSAEETHPLRRAVLRDGTASDVVEFDGDELDTTFHLGVQVDGELVAISTWLERPYPDRPAHRGFQLRGMATQPARRGEGFATRILDAGFARCRAAGAMVVWARARDTALPFYMHHGFAIVGLGYVDLTTGLPHHDIIRDITRDIA